MSKLKLNPDLSIEQNYHKRIIAGVDEAGRGAFAGPLVAAAVIVDQHYLIENIKDSKLLTKRHREYLYEKIIEHYRFAIAIITAAEIDSMGLHKANILACTMAINNIGDCDVALIDGNMKFSDPRFISIIKGDNKSISIAAASIVAKVTRDRIMANLSIDFPLYHWHQNAGYGTLLHKQGIRQSGKTSHHRHSFNIKL